jgi:hypothetical protein
VRARDVANRVLSIAARGTVHAAFALGRLCFLRSAQTFKTRYATFGLSDKPNLDQGAVWPTAFAPTELTAADEARIAAFAKKAMS